MSNASVDVSLGAVFSHTTSLIVKFSSPPANAMTDGKSTLDGLTYLTNLQRINLVDVFIQ